MEEGQIIYMLVEKVSSSSVAMKEYNSCWLVA